MDRDEASRNMQAMDTPSSAGGPVGHPGEGRHRAPAPGGRATPSDPMPGAQEAAGVPTAKRVVPPELGAGAIAVLESRSFVYSDSRGDVPPGSIGGFIRADTRFLSTWVLTMDGEPLPVLRSDAID